MHKLISILSITTLFITGCAKKEKPAEIASRVKETAQETKSGQRLSQHSVVEESKEAVDPDDVSQKVQSFTISGFSEDGSVKWKIEGETADILSEKVKLQNLKVRSFGKEASVVLTADKGVFDKDSKNVELMNNVLATADDGAVLKTEKLTWLAKQEKIVTSCVVAINRQDIGVKGRGAQAAPSMKFVQLDKDIQVDIKPSTTIKCDGPLEVDYNKNVAYFKNNVVIDDKRGKIYADQITAYFDPKRKSLTKAIAKGGVKIMRDQNYTTSDEATYLADEGRVVLTGEPKVVIYSTEEFLQKQR